MVEQAEIQVSGLRKSAIILLSLGQEIASSVISLLDREQIEEVINGIPEPVTFRCPNCSTIIGNCPECGIDLR